MWPHHPCCGAIGPPDEHRTEQPHCFISLCSCATWSVPLFARSQRPRATSCDTEWLLHLIRRRAATVPAFTPSLLPVPYPFPSLLLALLTFLAA